MCAINCHSRTDYYNIITIMYCYVYIVVISRVKRNQKSKFDKRRIIVFSLVFSRLQYCQNELRVTILTEFTNKNTLSLCDISDKNFEKPIVESQNEYIYTPVSLRIYKIYYVLLIYIRKRYDNK